MSRLHLYLLAGALTAAGLALAAWKVVVLGFPLAPQTKSEIWRVEVQAKFEAGGGPVKLALKIPSETGAATVIDQSFAARGYGVTTERSGVNRRAVYSIREASGVQVLFYRVALDLGRIPPSPLEAHPVLRLPAFADGELQAARSLVDEARATSADARSLAAVLLQRLRLAVPGDAASFLLGRNATQPRQIAIAADLLQLAGTPARVVNGLALRPERRQAHFVRWLEVHDGERWTAMHFTELDNEARRNLLPWWRGRGPLVELEGGKALSSDVTVSRSLELATRAAVAQQRAQNRKLIEFSLFGLPLQSQALFRTLLVIPLGVFVLVILRNVVGFKTFGTFMPVLIALAFRQTGIVAGVVFFVVVLGLGLAVRLYLERLKLLLIPRLAAVLIVVVMLMAVLTVLSQRMGLDVGLSIGLFPMVILTMTIERMTVTWEERGAAEALQQAGGSLAIAALCFALISHDVVEHLFFVFPELLLAVLAATLLLGRYTGYRLLEIRRFRVLTK